MREAVYWSACEDGSVRCGLCPHRCHIVINAVGICGVRENRDGRLFASGYGQVSSVALDPIEKKPLYMFHPGKHVLSVGGFGCNLRCPFCQNYEISMVYAGNPELTGPKNENEDENVSAIKKSKLLHAPQPSPPEPHTLGPPQRLLQHLSPDEIAMLAVQTVPDGNIGVAYTYNEPLIGYESLYDCAKLVHDAGLCNVLVTNGYINKEPLENLLPLIDAMNIDLKGFTDAFYKKVAGKSEAVKETIALSHEHCHVEITTLVIPGENEEDIEEIARWLSSIDPDIPLHLSRFFPRYRYANRAQTPRETIYKLSEIASRYLKNVFVGNMR